MTAPPPIHRTTAAPTGRSTSAPQRSALRRAALAGGATLLGLAALAPTTPAAATSASAAQVAQAASSTVGGAVTWPTACTSQWSGVILWRVVDGQLQQAANYSQMSSPTPAWSTAFAFAAQQPGEYRLTVHTGNPADSTPGRNSFGADRARFLGQVYGGASLPLHSNEMTLQQILAGTPILIDGSGEPVTLTVPLQRNPQAGDPGPDCEPTVPTPVPDPGDPTDPVDPVEPGDPGPSGPFSFSTPQRSGSTGSGDPRSIVAGDFDGDGVTDVANVDYSTSVHVHRSEGNGTVTSTEVRAAGNAPWHAAAADVDGDGAAEILTGDYASSSLSYYDRSGGTWKATRHDLLGQGVCGVGLGDFDGDGLPDLAAVNWTSGSLETLRQRTERGTFEPAVPRGAAGRGWESIGPTSTATAIPMSPPPTTPTARSRCGYAAPTAPSVTPTSRSAARATP